MLPDDVIRAEQCRWRALAGWKITYARGETFVGGESDPRWTNGCLIDPDGKRAIIKRWDGPESDFRKYIMHEVLHCVVEAARRGSDAEELLVVDLTDLVWSIYLTFEDGEEIEL